MHHSSLPYVLHAAPSLFFTISSPEWFWLSADHKSSLYVVSSNLNVISFLLDPYPSLPQYPVLEHLHPIFLSALKILIFVFYEMLGFCSLNCVRLG
jgi:hypothetical protein